MQIQHIVPAIIPESLDHLQKRLREVRGVASRVQVDVMDGTYAPPTTWPYSVADREAFEAIRREDDGLPYWQDFDFEVDLMVREPERRVEEWALAGAKCLIIHIESTERLEDIFRDCEARHVEVALALKPATDIEALVPYAERAVFVQCMGNDRIGYHGVSLDPAVPDKIRALKVRWPQTVVGVDIGVTFTTVPSLIAAGAERFAAGSAIFGGGDAPRAYQELTALVAEHHQ